MNYQQPCNPNASKSVHSLLKYLSSIPQNGILLGQHTQTRIQEELVHLEKLTGKLPAVCGFELLSYSPGANEETFTEECRIEFEDNKDTLKNAWEWAEKGGILTFTWHWFSPFGSRDKGFYAENTTFDATKVTITGTKEQEAFYSDMDHMAGLLMPFCEKDIPVLWRPFHESEGAWFWWGAKGPETAKHLYRIMYQYFTEEKKLNNLIWVWNSPLVEGYVGDEVADIISRDLYEPPHVHGDFADKYEELIKITPNQKLTALAEVGTVPGVEALAESRIPWIWYMTWSRDFCLTEESNSKERQIANYNHPYAITLDKLPKLY